MEALAEEVARKRKAKEELFGGRKYVKRGEMDAKMLEAKRAEETAERDKKAARLGSSGAGGAAPSARGDGTARAAAAAAVVDAARAEDLSPEEVIRRLRALGHPAKLFGEDVGGRRARLDVAVRHLSSVVDDALGGQQGNDFGTDLAMLEAAGRRLSDHEMALVARGRERAAQRAHAAEMAAAAAAHAATTDGGGAGGDGGGGGEGLSDEARTQAAFEAAAGALRSARAEANLCVEDQIRGYFKRLMSEWEAELASRPEEVRRSVQGQAMTATHNQAARYIKPLYALLKKRELPDDLQRGLWLIVKSMQARNYLQASDMYVKIAIGNAAWPIGVTMVGIHERSAREKIFAQAQAHVMNDEATRKYLQSVKRLMTFAQRAYPTDPSRCLEFNASIFGVNSDLKALRAMEAAGKGHDHRLLLEAPTRRPGETMAQIMTKAYGRGDADLKLGRPAAGEDPAP